MLTPMRASILLVLVAIVVECGGTSADGRRSFDVNVRYSCLQFNGKTGVCSEWQQKAALQYDKYGVNCFPGDAVVISDRGPRKMAELQIGDLVLGKDSQTGVSSFSPVRGWFHRRPRLNKKMVRVHLRDGASFVASKGHMLAVAREGKDDRVCDPSKVTRYSRAAGLKPNDCLVSANGSAVVVDRLERVLTKGVFSPFTWQSNFFVLTGHADDLNGYSSIREAILAHSFSNIADPQRYEWLWHHLLSLLELIVPSLHAPESFPTSGSYMHPVLRLLMGLDFRSGDDAVLTAEEDDPDEELGDGFEDRRLRGGSSAEAAQRQMLLQFSVFMMGTMPPFMPSPPVKPNPAMHDVNLTSKDVGDLTMKNVQSKNLQISVIALVVGVVCYFGFVFCRSLVEGRGLGGAAAE